MTPPSAAQTPLDDWVFADLARSGLSAETVRMMGIRNPTIEERGYLNLASSVDGYVIPYFAKDGSPASSGVVLGDEGETHKVFIRLRLREASREGARYLQPANSANHLYVLPLVWEVAGDPSVPLVITEGEKKAAKACQEGILTAGLGGVNNFVNHRFTVKVAEVNSKGMATFELRPQDFKNAQEAVVPELHEFVWDGREVICVYDSDAEHKPQVLQAAYQLAKWLYDHHARPRIVVLPEAEDGSKVGLDDYLLTHTAEQFREYVDNSRTPQLHRFLNEFLNRPGLRRNDYLFAAQLVIQDLNAHGRCYQDSVDDRQFYYFDASDRILYDIDWTDPASKMRVTAFSTLLQRRYGVDPADYELFNRLGAAFNEASSRVRPRRVSYAMDAPAHPENVLYVQLSDSRMCRVSSKRITIEENGYDEVLFKRGIVTPIEIDPTSLPEYPERRWREVIDQLNLDTHPVLTDDEERSLLEIMCYLSPWFRNWKGLELPIEIAVGEAGSGKSRFYYVRLGVLTGKPVGPGLGGTPRDVQELRVFLKDADGMFVFDNVRAGSLHQFREQFEEELARVVTVKQLSFRPLYTDEQRQVPIDTTVAITATRLPLHAADLVERSLVTHFKRLPVTKSVDDWDWTVLHKRPGRKALLEDMLVAARQFFIQAETNWPPEMPKSIRLEGFGRALVMMARALDPSGELAATMERVLEKLPRVISIAKLQADQALALLAEFAEARRSSHGVGRVQPIDIITWVTIRATGPRAINYPFRSPSELAAYLKEHEALIAAETGIHIDRLPSGKIVYAVQ